MSIIQSIVKPLGWFMAFMVVVVAAGCSSGGGGGTADTTAPAVSSTVPANAATAVALNANITATFSEAMDATTITDVTFTLKQGTTPVVGVVSYVGTTATFNPSANLAASTLYTASVTTGVKDVAGNVMAVAKTWSFTTGTTADTTAPTVSSTVPAVSATGVAVNANLTVTFSEAMDASTITATSITLMQGTTPVAGVVSYVGTTATFNPASDLAASTAYTATVSTGVADLAGNTLAVAKTWSFTTGTVADTTAPTVASTIPANASTGVSISGNIAITFSEAMDPITISTATISLMQGTTPVSGAVTLVGNTATFNPGSTLIASTIYTATVSTGVKDLAGNALAVAKIWSFTTGVTADTTAPMVSSIAPIDAASGVAVNTSVSATFSEAMDAATITTANFTLAQGTTAIAGAVSYSGTTATFKPNSDLIATKTYKATVTIGVKDLAGNALAVAKIWNFTTGATAAAGPAPVNLGTSGNFAVLAETLISTTATAGTAITGNIGVSPAAATFIQGFSLTLDPSGCFSTPTPSTLVVGKIYAADYNTNGCTTPADMTTAIGDMMIAYTDAAGRTLPDHTELGAGEIGGLTLAPGLYKWSTGVLISTDVTLNGSANDVWIFQIAGDLTMANGKSMLLTGGALPKNVFWQVAGGTGVAIGTTAHFEGIIMAAKAITVNTGATGNGRLLAQTAVTLDSNAVTQPAP